MKRLLFVIAACLTLAACVHQPQVAWYNPHPEDHNFDNERYECLKQANESAPTQTANGRDMFGDPYSYDINSDNRENLMRACMKTKGWELQQVAPQKGNNS
jgi:hypothetical protein